MLCLPQKATKQENKVYQPVPNKRPYSRPLTARTLRKKMIAFHLATKRAQSLGREKLVFHHNASQTQRTNMVAKASKRGVSLHECGRGVSHKDKIYSRFQRRLQSSKLGKVEVLEQLLFATVRVDIPEHLDEEGLVLAHAETGRHT